MRDTPASLEGTLVSSTYNKDYGKGRYNAPVQHTAWQVKVKSIRKLSRSKAPNVAAAGAASSAPPDEVPFLYLIVPDRKGPRFHHGPLVILAGLF